MAQLRAVEGPLKGQTFTIPAKDRVVVGRYEIYDLIVPDPSISRKHFALERRSDGIYLVDLGSLNGTQLNGHRVSTARLEQDDKIAAGQSVLSFEETGKAAPPGERDEILEVLAEADEGEKAVEVVAEAEKGEEVVEVLAEVDEGEEVVEVLAEVDEGEGAVEVLAEAGEKVEQIGDEDIVYEPAEGQESPPQTVPMKAAPPSPPARKAPPPRPAGGAVTKRTTKKQVKESAPKKSKSESLGRCAACGRKVAKEDLDAGGAEKVPQGYVCERCVKRHTKSGDGTTLEQFVVERKRRRRR